MENEKSIETEERNMRLSLIDPRHEYNTLIYNILQVVKFCGKFVLCGFTPKHLYLSAKNRYLCMY